MYINWNLRIFFYFFSIITNQVFYSIATLFTMIQQPLFLPNNNAGIENRDKESHLYTLIKLISQYFILALPFPPDRNVERRTHEDNCIFWRWYPSTQLWLQLLSSSEEGKGSKLWVYVMVTFAPYQLGWQINVGKLQIILFYFIIMRLHRIVLFLVDLQRIIAKINPFLKNKATTVVPLF